MKKTLFILLSIVLVACSASDTQQNFTGKDGEVKLIILDPGHFHAALAQKNMIPQINEEVHIYAPKGDELSSYLNLIESYNTRPENPTTWNNIVYSEEDYLEKMLTDKKGNVVVLAGKNKEKIKHITNSVKQGYSVLSDKPMIINKESFSALEQAYAYASQNNLVLYDLMTERYDVMNIIQRLLMQETELFGELIKGSPENPAVESQSIHHFQKLVSGSPLIRPQWYYDVDQQGDGITDVTTHLIDQIMWKCFPDKAINHLTDVKVTDANRWATKISLQEFQSSTNATTFPEFLQKDLINDTLNVFSNGNIQFEVGGVNVKVDVEWNVKAQEGTGDRHRFVVKGTKANIYILQDQKESYQPQLYIKKRTDISDTAFREVLDNVVDKLQINFHGVTVTEAYDGMLLINIPKELKLDHESHFRKVIEQFMTYLIDGKQPEWEIKNTLSKYFIITEALRVAKNK